MIAIALRLTTFRTRHAIGPLTLAELRPASATSWTGILALFAGFALKERRARDVLHHRQLLADQTLDLAQLGRLGRIAKRDGLAFRSVTSCAADAVNIALRLVRKVEVYHMADARNVDATRRDVGRNQNADLAGAEVVQSLLAGILRLVAMNNRSSKAIALEITGHTIGAMLGTCEDDDLLHGVAGKQLGQHGALLLQTRHDHTLADLGSSRSLRRDFHA